MFSKKLNLMFTLSLYYCIASCLAERHNYAVQVYPVVFSIQPQQILFTYFNKSISLTCQANVAQIVNKDVHLPLIQWRHNGSLIVTDYRHVINVNSSTGYSQLQIKNVIGTDTGVYECIADDSDGRYVTVSDPSQVKVLPKKGYVYNVTVPLHHSLNLDCHIIPSMSHLSRFKGFFWTFHNATILANQNTWELPNGSLLITNVSDAHEGMWTCSVKLGTEIIRAVSYNIKIIQGIGSHLKQNWFVLIHSNNTSIEFGKSSTLTCLSNFEVNEYVWLFSNSSQFENINITLGDNESITIDKLSNETIGFYICQATLDDGNIVSSNVFEFFIEAAPKILHFNSSNDIYLPSSNTEYVLDCSATGNPLPKVTWFKNGEILGYSQSLRITSQLKYGLFGTYQCVAENEFGRDMVLTRILVKDLCNPLGDLTVTSIIKKQRTHALNISWTPPLIRGGTPSLVYIIDVYYIDSVSFSRVSNPKKYSEGSNSYFFNINSFIPRVYYVDVEIYRQEKGLRTDDICVDTTLPYYLRETPPIYFSCSGGNVSVRWEPPGPSSLSNPVTNVHFTATCLHKESIQMFEYNTEELSNAFDYKVFYFIPNGAVCQFSGRYKIPLSRCKDKTYLSNNYQMIPLTNCTVPFDTNSNNNKNIELKIASFANKTVKMFWKIDKETLCKVLNNNSQNFVMNITGLCVDNGIVYKHYEYVILKTASLIGSFDFSNITDKSICTFFSSIRGLDVSSSPVQLIAGNSIPDEYKLNSFGSTSVLAVCTDSLKILSSSPLYSMSSSFSVSEQSLSNIVTTMMITEKSVSYFVPLGVGFAVISSVFVLTCILIAMMAIIRLRQKKRRLMLEVLNENGNGNCYQTSVIMKWTDAENISIKTEIQCPYYCDIPSFIISEGKETMSKNSEYESHGDPFNKNVTILGSQSLSALPDVHLWSMSNEHVDLCQLSGIPHTINKNGDLRIGKNGFTFQDNDTFNQDTSASSGYGSEITASSSEDYYKSLEPELKALEYTTVCHTQATVITNKTMKRVKSCPCITSRNGVPTKNDTLTLLNNEYHSKSVSSRSSSWNEIFSGSETDKLPNIFIDEKGYIRFTYDY